jgi:hypothetical protein
MTGWEERGLEELMKLLPAGWEQKAKELGAIRRARKQTSGLSAALLR